MKIRKFLNYHYLLITETTLSLFIALFFVSWKVTGHVVDDVSSEKINIMSLYFLVLGIVGLCGLVYSKRKQADLKN